MAARFALKYWASAEVIGFGKPLAYSVTGNITAVKGYIVKATGENLIMLFCPLFRNVHIKRECLSPVSLSSLA